MFKSDIPFDEDDLFESSIPYESEQLEGQLAKYKENVEPTLFTLYEAQRGHTPDEDTIYPGVDSLRFWGRYFPWSVAILIYEGTSKEDAIRLLEKQLEVLKREKTDRFPLDPLLRDNFIPFEILTNPSRAIEETYHLVESLDKSAPAKKLLELLVRTDKKMVSKIRALSKLIHKRAFK